MRIARTVYRLTDPLGEFARREHPVGFHDPAFAMFPRWLERIESWTATGQPARHGPHAEVGARHCLVVLAQPLVDLARVCQPASTQQTTGVVIASAAACSARHVR